MTFLDGPKRVVGRHVPPESQSLCVDGLTCDNSVTCAMFTVARGRNAPSSVHTRPSPSSWRHLRDGLIGGTAAHIFGKGDDKVANCSSLFSTLAEKEWYDLTYNSATSKIKIIRPLSSTSRVVPASAWVGRSLWFARAPLLASVPLQCARRRRTCGNAPFWSLAYWPFFKIALLCVGLLAKSKDCTSVRRLSRRCSKPHFCATTFRAFFFFQKKKKNALQCVGLLAWLENCTSVRWSSGHFSKALSWAPAFWPLSIKNRPSGFMIGQGPGGLEGFFKKIKLHKKLSQGRFGKKKSCMARRLSTLKPS